jgi:hypothetical protein
MALHLRDLVRRLCCRILVANRQGGGGDPTISTGACVQMGDEPPQHRQDLLFDTALQAEVDVPEAEPEPLEAEMAMAEGAAPMGFAEPSFGGRE